MVDMATVLVALGRRVFSVKLMCCFDNRLEACIVWKLLWSLVVRFVYSLVTL